MCKTTDEINILIESINFQAVYENKEIKKHKLTLRKMKYHLFYLYKYFGNIGFDIKPSPVLQSFQYLIYLY